MLCQFKRKERKVFLFRQSIENAKFAKLCVKSLQTLRIPIAIGIAFFAVKKDFPESILVQDYFQKEKHQLQKTVFLLGQILLKQFRCIQIEGQLW